MYLLASKMNEQATHSTRFCCCGRAHFAPSQAKQNHSTRSWDGGQILKTTNHRLSCYGRDKINSQSLQYTLPSFASWSVMIGARAYLTLWLLMREHGGVRLLARRPGWLSIAISAKNQRFNEKLATDLWSPQRSPDDETDAMSEWIEIEIAPHTGRRVERNRPRIIVGGGVAKWEGGRGKEGLTGWRPRRLDRML